MDQILDILKDGKWHSLQEIIDQTKIQERKVRLITSFLQKFQLVQLEKKNKRIRVDALTKQFIEMIDPTTSYEEITA
jgi:DNA-binding IclR family transcriptional regulator